MHASNSVLEHPSSSQPDYSSLAQTTEFRRPDVQRTVEKRSGIVLSWPLAATVLAITATATVQPWKWVESHPVSASESPEVRRTVQLTQPSRATTANVTLPGTMRSWQTATLNARVNGYLKAWHRDLGEEVRAGELLAEIDTPELDQELAQGRALESEAVAAVVQAKAERSEAEADLKVAEAQLNRAQAELTLARSQLVRREQLLQTKIIVQEEYDTALRQVETRTAEVDAARADVVRRRTNLETRAAIIATRESTARSRRANVQRLEELQGFQRIVAPFDGVVTRRAAEVGMLVTAGKEPMFVLDDMSRIRLQVQVPQTYSSLLRPGLSATINLPESSAGTFNGTITRMAEAVEAASRTMLAEIELDNAAHRLQPGSYVQVTLDIPQATGAWTVPSNTVGMKVDGPQVAIVTDDDRVELRRITLGRDLGTRVVVTDGIRGGERLVVNPTDDLADGTLVQTDRAGAEHVSRNDRQH